MKKISLVIIFILIMPTISFPIRSIDLNSSNTVNIDWWTCFHHDAQNTGYSSSETLDEGNLLWTYDTGSPVLSSPAIVDNKVYIGCGGDKRTVCLNATNGNEIWRYHTVGRVYTSPAVDDGRIYIGDDGGIMYCLNAEDGTEIWTYHIIYSQIKSSPTVWDDRLYFGDGGGRIFCLNTKTGRKIWSRLSGYRIESCPAVWQGKVYFGGEDRRMHCFGAHTGRFIWSFKTGFWIHSSPALGNGQVYVGSYDDRLYVFGAYTGRVIRIIETGSIIISSPAIWDDKVYVGSYDDKVYCLNEYGWKIWSYKTGGDVHSSPAVADGKLYVGSKDKNFYCLNAMNGSKIWSYETGAGISSSPAVCDGKVYIGSDDGKLYCFGSVDENRLQVDAGGPYSEHSGESIQFNGLVSGGTPPYSWSWDFDDSDGIQSDGNQQQPIFSYNKSGWYTATLRVTDANGLTGVDNSEVTISSKNNDIIITEVNCRGLGLNAILHNNGSNTAVNIEWSITFYQGIEVYLYTIPTAFFISGTASRGVIDEIAPGESKIIRTSKLCGFGLVVSTIDVEKERKAIKFFLLIGPSLFDLTPIINKIIPDMNWV